MKCVKCGRSVSVSGFCTGCGFDNKHVAKAKNTANYYYNIGLEKAQIEDLSGAEFMLSKALTFNKKHREARNLLGLVYYRLGEKGKAYIQWRISAKLNPGEENVANQYIRDMEEHPAVFDELNETAKKFNLALSYAKQGSDDLALIQIKKVLSITPSFVRGHLLFALLHMRSGDEKAAKADLTNALAIDKFNTTARRYLKELGDHSTELVEDIDTDSMKPESNNLKNIRHLDHYEDPSKETWKQFVYMMIGLAIGVVAMFILVIPSVKAGVSIDYNKLKKQYNETVEQKDGEISSLQDDKEELQQKNKKLNKQLKVYEGKDGKESMYDHLLNATTAYDKGDYIECAKELAQVTKDSLPTNASKTQYNKMSATAAAQAYSSGKALYDKYKYSDALDTLKASYEIDSSNYNTIFHMAMCYKQLDKMDTAKPYFYDIINNCQDRDIVVKAANYGLEMQVADAEQQATKYKEESKKEEE